MEHIHLNVFSYYKDIFNYISNIKKSSENKSLDRNKVSSTIIYEKDVFNSLWFVSSYNESLDNERCLYLY